MEKGSPPEINAPPPQGYLPRPLVVLFLLSLLATLIYSNTFSSPFYFDDTPNIVENPQIKDLSNFLDFSGPRGAGDAQFSR